MNPYVITVSLFLVSLSLGTGILLFRTRSTASKVMGAGLVLFWLGTALAAWGPENTATRSEGPGVMVIQKSAILPVAYVMGAGILLFAGGFVFHATQSRKRDP